MNKSPLRTLAPTKMIQSPWGGRIFSVGLLTLLLPLSAKAQEQNRVWITGRVFWDRTSDNWDEGSPWVDGNTAEFNEGTGIVLIAEGAEPLSVSGLVFNTTSTIADGSITLSGTSPSDISRDPRTGTRSDGKPGRTHLLGTRQPVQR